MFFNPFRLSCTHHSGSFARETMQLHILRDALDTDELTTDAISARELALDKELITLLQGACKADRLARALDLARLLHHPASLDMAAKLAGFYHLVGLQEKIGLLRDAREAHDRLEEMRGVRHARATGFAAVPRARTLVVEREQPRARAFQDFRPPPAIRRPGLERAAATPAPDAGPSRARTARHNGDDFQTNAADDDDDDYGMASPDGKRKRSEEPPAGSTAKRRATDEASASARVPLATQTKANPFARKTGADAGRNPFTKNSEMNKSLHKSESFFNKVDAAENEKGKRKCSRRWIFALYADGARRERQRQGEG